MADLPARPSLNHLRRQARDLLRAARAGDTTAAGRIRAVADALTLASAQRGYGFASRTRLRYEVTARTASLARQAEAFCEASIRDGTGRAARMLAATPELARYSFATAVIPGDVGRVRTELCLVVMPLDVLVQYRRALYQLLGSVVGSLYPVYPHDGDQVPFDLIQHPVRTDAQPTVGAADERARRRRIVS